MEEVPHGAFRDGDQVGHLPGCPKAVVDDPRAFAAAGDRRRAAAHDAIRVLVELPHTWNSPAQVCCQVLMGTNQKYLRFSFFECLPKSICLRTLIFFSCPQTVDIGGIFPIFSYRGTFAFRFRAGLTWGCRGVKAGISIGTIFTPQIRKVG